ncbi:DapH/DapD/GlmU-related protein [Candidatus Magnetaquicoccus inordinatus]|uniref:DapH/DapD/GlmU-related protein n=1 Tax=Candidatus Magnetaquicoccus inordinatus TaxID=2496818 RepID=UPI00102BB6CE|nr:acyltransferase [Candidatus Magnetaquicoccus inordinatus]
MERVNVSQGTLAIREVLMGERVRYFSFVNLYECTIGSDSKIGTFVEIQKNAVIGERCKISSHTFICEGVHIGNDVFVGHGVMFINDKLPRASHNQQLITDEWTLTETHIEDEVSIGSNATILCGVRIGRGALIGAGAVVTHDVAPGAVVMGNPARERLLAAATGE